LTERAPTIPRVLEIAASARVLRERRALALAAQPQRALLGRTFLTFRGLAEQCAWETGAEISGWLGDGDMARLVESSACASPRFATLVGRRPGLAAALAATLRDLRDAGVAPDALPDGARELRQVYAASERALGKLAERGLYDRVGLFRLAARGAPAWIRRIGFERAEVHGATELVGSVGDLIEELSTSLPLRFFQPDWGGDFARELRDSWPWSFAPEPVAVGSDPDEPAATTPVGTRLVRADGPREELEFVAREILRLLESGAKPAEICVVARSLEPYAAWIESVFRRYGIPYSSSLSEPVLRLPGVRSWLDLVQTLFGNLERGAFLRLLRSPRLELAGGHTLPQLAEWLSRRAAVVRGDDWSVALSDAERLAAQDARHLERRQIDSLRRVLGDLERTGRALRDARGFGEAARRVLELGDRLFGPVGEDGTPDELARSALAAAAQLDDVDLAVGRGARPSPEELRAALERALRSARWRPRSEDNGGVRILDALQARALPTHHLFLIGLQHGAWPHLRREDAFLSDELRASLRRRTGRPVPTAGLAEQEERFLFGLLLSQARSSRTLTRPLADASGRQLAASAFLRELGPATGESFDPEREIDATSAIDRDFLTFTEAATRIALELAPQKRSRAMRELAREHASDAEEILVPGLAHIEATEGPEPNALRYDGVLAEPPSLPNTISPSFLETLGNCPLKAFFERVLRVRKPDAPPQNSLGAAEAGSLLHALLARLYRQLFDAGVLRPGTAPAQAVQRARELLPGALGAVSTELARASRQRHPELWTSLQQLLEAAALDFVERDLEVLLPEGVSELHAERELGFRFHANGGELEIRGRSDRIVRRPSGALRVGDYKTSRDPGAFLRRRNLERGSALQVPLYTLAAARVLEAETVIGEILSVPLRPERDPRGERGRERQLDLETVEAAVPRPLAVLGDLLRHGRFPFRSHDGCRYCSYTLACRRDHPASARRVANFEGFERYFALQRAAE
jgi:RecB family exonuclease